MTWIYSFYRFEAFLIAQGWLCQFPPVEGSERAKILILSSWKIFDGWSGPNFFHLIYDPKTLLHCIFRQFREYVFEKNPFCVHPFEPKKAIFYLWGGCFWPKTWKKMCFQLIQSKISHFGTQMWPHKKLKILVPRTPPDPPLPPLTPPRGLGGPKMAKMHSH